jgi:prophage regulatory protein
MNTIEQIITQVVRLSVNEAIKPLELKIEELHKVITAQKHGENEVTTNNPVLRIKAIKEITGIGVSTVYAQMSIGLFPKPIKLGDRISGWLTSEVLAVRAARIAGQTDEQIKALVKQIEGERLQAIE